MYNEIKNAIVELYLETNQFNSDRYLEITDTKNLGRVLGMLIGINPSCLSRKIRIVNDNGPDIILCSALLEGEDINETSFFSDCILFEGKPTYICMMNLNGIVSDDPTVQYEVLSRAVKKVTSIYVSSMADMFIKDSAIGYPIIKVSLYAYPILYANLANELLHRKKYIKNSNFILEDEIKHRQLVLKFIKESYFGKNINIDLIDSEFSIDENGYSDILDAIDRLLKISIEDLLDNSLLSSAAEEQYWGLFKITRLMKIAEDSANTTENYDSTEGYDNTEDYDDGEDEIYND